MVALPWVGEAQGEETVRKMLQQKGGGPRWREQGAGWAQWFSAADCGSWERSCELLLGAGLSFQ